MSRLDDIQKLRRNVVLLLKPLHSPIDIGLVIGLYLWKEGLDGHALIPSLLDEDRIGEGKYPLVEC